ncbi:MAG: hypothetical protein HZA54_05770 [Planctomycetes bacterium]|nr:hypothetical protein [Planctomycetota bacterium]
MKLPRLGWFALVLFLLSLAFTPAEAGGGSDEPGTDGAALNGFWQLSGSDRFGAYKGTLRVTFLSGNLYRLEGQPAYADGTVRNWTGDGVMINRHLSVSHSVPEAGLVEALAGQAPPTDVPPRISHTFVLDEAGMNLRGTVRFVRGPVKVSIGSEAAARKIPQAAGFENVQATESTLVLHVWRSAPKRLKYSSPRALFFAYLVNHALKSKHSIGHVAVEIKTTAGAFPRGNFIYAGHTGDPEPFMLKLAKQSAPLREVFDTFPCGYLHGRLFNDDPHVSVEFKITREQAVAAMDYVTRYKGEMYGLFPAGATSSDEIVEAGPKAGGGCISFGVGVLAMAGMNLNTLNANTMEISKTWMEEGGYRWWMLPLYPSWRPSRHPASLVTFYTPDLLADWLLNPPAEIKEKFRPRVLRNR